MFLSHFPHTQPYTIQPEGALCFTPNGHKGRRLKENLTNVNAVFADFDFRPKEVTGDGKPDFKQFMLDLDDLPTPTFVVESGNGWHVYWLLEESIVVNDENRDELIKQVEGIHRFLHQHYGSDAGAMDVLRAMRQPGYEHRKQPEHPFLVSVVIDNEDTRYTLDELLTAMPPVYKEVVEVVPSGGTDFDIRQVAIDAWAERGDTVSWDTFGRMIWNGKRTGTFLGRQGENYIATTSTEFPYRGNPTTYVAGVLGVSTKEAYEWLVSHYGAPMRGSLTGGVVRDSYSDPIPERTEYLEHLALGGGDKDWVKRLKYLREDYFVNFYKRVAQLYPHLKYEIGLLNSFWDYDSNEGVYYKVATATLSGLIIRALRDDEMDSYTTEAQVKRVILNFTAYKERGVTLNDFSLPPGYLHVKNGWLNLKTLELTDHSPDKLSLSKMGVGYDPEATCPLYSKFLDVDTQMPVDQVRVIDQFSGYILTSGIEQQQCLIFEGTPGCGKSMLPEIWLEVLGKNGTTASLKSLNGAEVRFMGDRFAHKNFCFFDEANPRTDSLSEYFQNLITKPMISIERKGIQDSVDVKNSLKIVLALNEMPDHMPPGMDRRMRHLRFTRSFTDDGTADKDYKTKVIRSELSGVLNRMLVGLHDYWKMGGLTSISGEEERKREYVLAADDFSAFVADNFDPRPKTDRSVRYSLMEFLGSFVHDYGKPYHKQLSPRGFNKKLLALRLPEFKHITFAMGNERKGYRGLELKPDRHFVDDGFGNYRIKINGEEDQNYRIIGGQDG